MSARRSDHVRGMVGLISIVWGVAFAAWAFLDWVGYSSFFGLLYLRGSEDLPQVAPFPLRTTYYLGLSLLKGWSNAIGDGGLTGLAVPLLAALILLGPASLFASRAWHPRATRIGIWVTLLLAAVALPLAILRVEHAWREYVDYVSGGASDDWTIRARHEDDAELVAHTTQFLASAAVLVAGSALVVVRGARWARRDKESGDPTLVPAVTTVSVGLLVVFAALASLLTLVWPVVTWQRRPSPEGGAELFESFVWLEAASKGVALFAVVATFTILAMRDDVARSAPTRAASIGVGSLIVGSVAWLLARASAYDATHPLPAWVRFEAIPVHVPLPERTSCASLRDGSLVEFGPDRVWIDGTSVGSPADGPDEFQKLLKSKVDLWHAISPQRTFAGVLCLGVTPELRMDLVGPFLVAARSVGYREIDALVARTPRRFASRTRGTLVEHRPVCRVTHRLDDPLPMDGDWRQWVERLESPQDATAN